MAQRTDRLAELRAQWLLEAARRDVFAGDREADFIGGTLGDDTIFGFAGDDLLVGWSGRDEIFGGAGDDTIIGGPGDDLLYGRHGWDVLLGGNGDDVVDGGAGRDILRGGHGADTLVGGNGHDLLIGGADGGRDVFVFEGDFGLDRIRGFEAATDVVRLDRVPDSITPTPAGSLVITAGGSRITIDVSTPIMIDVAGVNDIPLVTPTLAPDVAESAGAVAIDLLANARDPEDDPLAVVNPTVVLRQETNFITPGDPRYVDLSGAIEDGVLRFDTAAFDKLAAGQRISIDVGYSVSDGGSVPVSTFTTVTVVGENDAPTLGTDDLDLATDDGLVTYDLSTLGDDVDLDDDGTSLTYALDPSRPVAGVSISGTTLTIDPTLVAGPVAPGGTGEAAIGIVATDRHGATATNTIDVEVAGPPEPSPGWYGQQLRYRVILGSSSEIHTTDVTIGDGIENTYHPTIPIVTFDLQEDKLVIQSSGTINFGTEIGIRYDDFTGLVDDFASATINTTETTATLGDASVSSGADFIAVQLDDIEFTAGEQLVIDLDFV